jgi:hypothetical protein
MRYAGAAAVGDGAAVAVEVRLGADSVVVGVAVVAVVAVVVDGVAVVGEAAVVAVVVGVSIAPAPPTVGPHALNSSAPAARAVTRPAPALMPFP